jgi:hypothetical protein
MRKPFQVDLGDGRTLLCIHGHGSKNRYCRKRRSSAGNSRRCPKSSSLSRDVSIRSTADFRLVNFFTGPAEGTKRARRKTNVSGVLKRWSKRWNWPERALALDAMLDAQRLAEVVKAVRKEGQKWAARWRSTATGRGSGLRIRRNRSPCSWSIEISDQA